MTEAQELNLSGALASFNAPKISAFRDDYQRRWVAGFKDASLAEEILENPRLHTRAGAEICAGLGVGYQFNLPFDKNGRIVSVMMAMGLPLFRDLLGCLWHRKTVLDWITWNQIEEKCPHISFEDLKTCLRNVPASVNERIGAPSEVEPNLDADDLHLSGAACLAAWAAHAPSDVGERLSLFIDLPDDPDHPGAALVPAFAAVFLEEGS
ncbi:MAG: hypothetical protein AAGD04_03465 [Pseudomonadota bacterium]